MDAIKIDERYWEKIFVAVSAEGSGSYWLALRNAAQISSRSKVNPAATCNASIGYVGKLFNLGS
jgi:hypothetical protein